MPVERWSDRPGSHARALAWTAASYAVLHHLGALPGGLGAAPEGTRWVDWLDLLLPWAVLAPAALALHAARSPASTWALLGLGAVAYADGHGIHLAANSVANTAPGPTAHLWDEVVGHLLWYAGVALVAAALERSARRRPRPRGRELALALALAVGAGVTWATNARGGVGTTVPGLVLALVATGAGWRRRDELAGLFGVAGAAAVVALGVLHVVG